MAIDGRLNFDTKIDTKGFSKGINSLGNQLNNLRNIVLKMGAALGTVFSGKEALEAAADINAANSQMQQTFGTLKSAADNAMKSVADNSSILQTRLQNVGTSIYAFAKTTGMDSVSALKMMEEALQVTADSAAYYDRSLEDTAESLKSFLKGNFENDAALGLSCTETTRNTAANKLYGKSFMELSEAQKQLTLLQMVKDANALSGAEGQAAREADGWENVIGNLKESWKQLLAVIGQPVLSGAVTVVKNITAELQSLTAVANSAVKALSEVFGIKLMNTTDGVAESSSQAAENYSGITAEREKLTVRYDTFCKTSNFDEREAAKLMLDELEKNRENDIRRQFTGTGPHKDDLSFFINKRNARIYGSQGQQRSCALSLKLAEADILEKITEESPIILLDDVMSELDDGRQELLLERLGKRQVFITCCDPSQLLRLQKGKAFEMIEGSINEI